MNIHWFISSSLLRRPRIRPVIALIAGIVVVSSAAVVGPRGTSAQETTITVFVAGLTDTWTDTGIALTSSVEATITATGFINANVNCTECVPLERDPNGPVPPFFPTPDYGFLASGINSHSLIGRVGDGAPFFVGTGPITFGGAGELYLAYNDNVFWDNSGGFTVTITLRSAKLTVGVDIKPGSDPNCIKAGKEGIIPTAVLGSASLDVTTVDPLTIVLAGGAVRLKGKSGNAGGYEDVNGDGFLDLVVRIEDWTLVAGQTTAILTGALYDGTPITGSDAVCVIA